MSPADAADTQIRVVDSPQTAAAPGGEAVTTILPRIEWVGAEPRLHPSVRERFEEMGLLGTGGMGEVVLAKDHDIVREVAVKRLPLNAGLDQVLRFVEEIRTVGQLEHPNIVPVHDVGIDSLGRYYFVMKALRGETLETIIARIAAKDPATLARFSISVRVQTFLSLLNALAYAHGQGFIHRDLKPANVMVGPFGEVTVVDWGVAKRIRGPQTHDHASEPRGRVGTSMETQLGAIIGTPMYMSPEQAIGANDALDERSDIYSLCVLFHEFLHGEHYLKGITETKEVLKAIRSGHVMFSKGPPVPNELDWFLRAGLGKDPAQRYQTVTQMHEALQRILRGECPIQCEVTLVKRGLAEAAQMVDRFPIAGLSAAAAVVALAVVGVVTLALRLF